MATSDNPRKGETMPILVTTRIKGQTAQGYDQVSAILHDLVRPFPGFVLHCAYQGEDWTVMEVWRSKAESDQFFAKNVAPNLPKGIVPKRTYTELHALVTP